MQVLEKSGQFWYNRKTDQCLVASRSPRENFSNQLGNVSSNNNNRKDNKNDTQAFSRQKLTGGRWIGQLTDRLKLERSESSVAVADRR